MVEIDMEEEIFKAKTLIKKGSEEERNVYDSITGMIKNLMNERPKNSIELVEGYLKKQNNDEKVVHTTSKSSLVHANTQMQLFEKRKEEDVVEGGETEEEFEIPLPNCQYQSFLFEQASIGLGREEMQKIILALKQLVFIYPIATIRFWGKMFGIDKDYIIAEVEFREGEGEDEEELIRLKRKIIIEQEIMELITSDSSNHVPSNQHKTCIKCGLRKQLTTKPSSPFNYQRNSTTSSMTYEMLVKNRKNCFKCGLQKQTPLESTKEHITSSSSLSTSTPSTTSTEDNFNHTSNKSKRKRKNYKHLRKCFKPIHPASETGQKHLINKQLNTIKPIKPIAKHGNAITNYGSKSLTKHCNRKVGSKPLTKYGSKPITKYGKSIDNENVFTKHNSKMNDSSLAAQVKSKEREEEKPEETMEMNEEEEGPTEENELPKSSWKPPPDIPKEEVRTGTNKKVYFVCNSPGDDWVKLPHVTPKEISTARKITKFLTGSLEAPISSYPPFPGLEKNYLRAQIARISAGSQISPAGFYMFDDEEEEEEEELRESYTVNADFEGLSLRELVEPSMSSWVHHSHHILPQGRCTWYNPIEKNEDDFDEEEFDEDEDDDIRHSIPPETGPSLLTSVRLDAGIGSTPAWSIGLSSNVLPEYSVAVAKSNRWPGAYAIAKGKFYENIYIGWGNKYANGAFTPAQPPSVLDEFIDTEGVTNEIEDPSIEEERALREREEEARKEAEEMENLEDDEDDD